MSKKLYQLRQVKKIVTAILEEDKKARNDDRYLYMQVIKRFEKILGLYALDYPLEMFLTDSMFKDFPCFETVRRSRQRVQAKRPDLASDKRIEQLRNEQEQDYRTFAKENLGGN